jgi:hypothetical protein
MKKLQTVLLAIIITGIPKLTFAQYHVDGPGTEACYEKIKQSGLYKEALAELKLKPSDITMGFISSRDYDCYGKNILRCDGDIFIGRVSLTSSKDKDGVHYKGFCNVIYRRLNSYCNLQPTFEYGNITLYPFHAYGKKASIKDETKAKELLKQALENPKIIRKNIVPINDYGLVKITDVKFDFIPSNWSKTTNDSENMIIKSEGTAEGGQTLVYSAVFTIAQYNDKHDIILKLKKSRVLINLSLDKKNIPEEINIVDLVNENPEEANKDIGKVFDGGYDNPYDTLLANYLGSGVNAVWEKTTQLTIPFTSKLYKRKLFKEMSEQLELLSEDKQKNKEILSNYVDEKILDKWLTSLEVATNKKLKISVEPNPNDQSFNFTFLNKKNQKKGASNSFGLNGFEYSDETGKLVREIICQFY